MNCGSDIIHEDCVGAVIPYGYTELGFKVMFGEIVSIGTFLLGVSIAAGGKDMTPNMNRALNSLRCAFVAGYVNSWMVLASIYFALRQFGMQQYVVDFVNNLYPRICTCKQDVKLMQKIFGTTDDMTEIYSTCTEKFNNVATTTTTT